MNEKTEWFCMIDDKQEGPFSAEDVHAMIKKGELTGPTLVWKKGWPHWRPVNKVRKLRACIVVLPPPLPKIAQKTRRFWKPLTVTFFLFLGFGLASIILLLAKSTDFDIGNIIYSGMLSIIPNESEMSVDRPTPLPSDKAVGDMVEISGAKNNKKLTIAEISKLSSSVVLLNIYNKTKELIASGSGFIASNDGIIVTNYHVIKGAYSVDVICDDDTIYKVDGVLGYDIKKDIAILKTSAIIGMNPQFLGSSDNLKSGDEIVAIGSPEGLKNTVSSGIISALRNDGDRELIQISAPISPGSSGGVLLNMFGEAIGVTCSYIEEGQNLNFAIPINDIKKVLANPVEQKTFFELKEETYKRGNTIGNYANRMMSGSAAFNGEWIFYSGKEGIGADDRRPLSRVNAQLFTGSDKDWEVLDEFPSDARSINVIDEWIYYTALERVMKIKTDGTNGGLVYSGDYQILDSLLVTTEGVVYSTMNNDWSFSIFSNSIDFDNEIKVFHSPEGCTIVGVLDDWIYFRQYIPNSGDTYFRVRTDGTALENFPFDKAGRCLNITDEGIFYIKDYSDSTSAIYKMNVDESISEPIVTDSAFTINVCDGWIYYCNMDDGFKVYKVRTDGSSKMKVSDVGAGSIVKVGNWLLCESFDNSISIAKNLIRLSAGDTKGILWIQDK